VRISSLTSVEVGARADADVADMVLGYPYLVADGQGLCPVPRVGVAANLADLASSLVEHVARRLARLLDPREALAEFQADRGCGVATSILGLAVTRLFADDGVALGGGVQSSEERRAGRFLLAFSETGTGGGMRVAGCNWFVRHCGSGIDVRVSTSTRLPCLRRASTPRAAQGLTGGGASRSQHSRISCRYQLKYENARKRGNVI
jgi:hypothetical protein